jgi:hypothetical protein
MSLEILPEVLLSLLFTSWLTIVDVAGFDSALCSRRRRSDLLRVAYAPNAALQYPSDSLWRCNDELNKWILGRECSVSKFCVTTFVTKSWEQFYCFLERNGNALRVVERSISSTSADRYMEFVDNIIERCPNLVKLEGTSGMHDDDWALVAANCPLLQEVTEANFTFNGLQKLRYPFASMHKICMACKAVVTDALVAALCAKAPNLTHFTHNNLLAETPLTDSMLAILVDHCPSLVALDINGRFLTDSAMHTLTARCTQLHTLCLYDSTISPAAVIDLSSVCILRKLGLHEMRNITMGAVELIFAKSPSLRSFSGSGRFLFWISLSGLAARCPLLEQLTLAGDVYIPENFTGGGKLVALRILALTRYTGLIWRTLHTALCAFPSLEHLDLSYSSTDDGILVAVTARCSRTLQVLILRGSKAITDAGILATVRACRQLRSLNVEKCKWVTKEGMDAVQEVNGRLRPRGGNKRQLGEAVHDAEY